MKAIIQSSMGLCDPAELKPGLLVKVYRARPYRDWGIMPPLNQVMRVTAASIGTAALETAKRETYNISTSDAEIGYVSKEEGAVFRANVLKMVLDEKRNTLKSNGWQTGSDPEVFVTANDEVLPAFAFLPSKKEQCAFHPGGVPSSGYKAFWDGFQAEFTVPSFSCHAYGMDYIRNGLEEVLRKARTICPHAKLSSRPVVTVPEDIMSTAPPECVELGCEPSLNIYFNGQNPRLEGLDATQLKHRFAGFHVHLGSGPRTPAQNRKTVAMMDKVAGIASVLVLRGLEDPIRRQYYGLAGEHRLPAYGLEYRTLSSACLCHPVVTNLMMDLARTAAVWSWDRIDHCWDCGDDEAQDIIDTLNVEGAEKVIERNRAALLALLKPIYGRESRNNAMAIITKGAKEILEVNDMEASWKLFGTWEPHCNKDQDTVTQLILKEK